MRGVWLLLVAGAGCAVAGAPRPATMTSEDRAKAVPVRSVVVYDIEDPSGALPEDDLQQLSAFFRARLAERSWFRVVQDDRAADQLAAEKRAALGPGRDESTQVELGRAVSASHAVRTELLRLGDRCTVTAALYAIETETRVDTRSENVPCLTSASRDALERLSVRLGAPDMFEPDGRWRITASTVLGSDTYDLVLVSSGANVVGTAPNGGRWEGVIVGRILKAVWRKGGFAGRLEVRFAKDGLHMAGTYGLGEEDATFDIAGRRLE